MPLATILLITSVAALASFLINGRLMPLFRRFALARPNARSSHTAPTPQGGGLGVLLACGPGFLAALQSATLPGAFTAWGLASMAAGAVLLAAVGAIDDLRPLPAGPRLLAQAVAAALGLWSVGVSTDLSIGDLPALLLWPALGLGLIWFINLTNFMDGIDGITIAEFLPILATLALLSLLGLFPANAGLLAAALFGGLAGFAPYNWHVARLFLGDTGSLSIGFMTGCLLLKLALSGHPISALILPAYYLADATLTLLTRLQRGEPITEAHRTHFYQRATSLGWRVPEITALIVKANLGLGSLALVAAWTNEVMIQIVSLAAAAALTAWLLRQLSRAPLR